MVCLGNICRSPMAEGMLTQKLKPFHLPVTVDSAGFERVNEGNPPDLRASVTMEKHGYDIRYIRARLFSVKDFDVCDKIYVMDENNYRSVLRFARNDEDKAKVEYLMNEVYPTSNQAIADPYYGGIDGFETTFGMIDLATDKIVERLTKAL